MNILISIILIGIGLSMDSFSLSFSYGTLNINKEKRLLLSTIVGVYHFVMPLLGLFIGNVISNFLIIDFDILLGIIIILIGIDMIISSFKKEENNLLLTIGAFLLFGLSVSIDSFSVGIGLKAISNNYLMVSFIFSLCSFVFTYVGLILGTKLNDFVGKYAQIFGGLVLVVLGVNYLI